MNQERITWSDGQTRVRQHDVQEGLDKLARDVNRNALLSVWSPLFNIFQIMKDSIKHPINKGR